MGVLNTFNQFAAAFESAVNDNNWSQLAPFLSEGASYVNIGGPDPKSTGRDAVINFLKNDVANTDKRFDSRSLIALTPPLIHGPRLSRKWRCTYTLKDTPNLIVEGEARYLIENELIKEIEEEVTTETTRNINEWMQLYANRLLK